MAPNEDNAKSPENAGRPGNGGRGLVDYALTAAGVCALAGAVALVYRGTLDAPFLLDDSVTVERNPSIVRLWPLVSSSGEPSPLSPSRNLPTSARPLVNLSLALNYAWSGLEPRGYHALNVVIHLLAALTLWGLVDRTLRLPFFAGRFACAAGVLSFGAALVWAVHPLNTESVAYVTQRTEAMMGLCYFATLYASLRYWTSEPIAARALWMAAATVAGIAGALSKEMIVSAPAVALMFERTFVAGSFARALRASWPLYVSLTLIWATLGALRALGMETPQASFDLGCPAHVWWMTQAEALWTYLRLSIWPAPLVIHYDVPYLETFAAAWPWLGATMLLAIVSLVLFWRRYSAGFVAAAFFAVLSPTLIVPLVGETIAERRTYVPLAAIATLVVVGLHTVLQGVVRRVAPRAPEATRDCIALVAWCCATAVTTVALVDASARRVALYARPLLLLEDAVRYQPNDIMLLVNLGGEQAKGGRTRDALATFERAERLFDDSDQLNHRLNRHVHVLYHNMGMAHEERGKLQSAEAYYRRAIDAKPDYAVAHYHLGELLLREGQANVAATHFAQALESAPDFSEARLDLGVALATAGKLNEALPYLERGAREKPNFTAYVNLVGAYQMLGRERDAVSAAKTAVELARAEGQSQAAGQLQSWIDSVESGTPRP